MAFRGFYVFNYFPGGFIDRNESAEETVRREALEETGLIIEVGNYLGSSVDVYGERNIPTLNLAFEAKVVGGTQRAQSDVDALDWFDLNQLCGLEMAFPHQMRILEWCKTRLQRDRSVPT